MSGSEFDLDAYLPDDKTLDRWANGIIDLTGEQALALVAEVRRLRTELDNAYRAVGLDAIREAFGGPMGDNMGDSDRA